MSSSFAHHCFKNWRELLNSIIKNSMDSTIYVHTYFLTTVILKILNILRNLWIRKINLSSMVTYICFHFRVQWKDLFENSLNFLVWSLNWISHLSPIMFLRRGISTKRGELWKFHVKIVVTKYARQIALHSRKVLFAVVRINLSRTDITTAITPTTYNAQFCGTNDREYWISY